MKKKTLLRLFLFSVLGLVLLVGLLVGLAFNGSVQTWAARRAVAGQPGKLDIGGVAVGLQNIHVENIRIEQPGVVLILPSADVVVPVVDAARGQVKVARLTAKGWTLDLSKPAPLSTKPAAARAAFDGIFQYLKLPVDVALEVAELEGDIILPQGRLHLALTGGQLGAGRDGQLTLVSELKLDDPKAPVNALSVHATIAARMDTPRSFEKLGVTVDAVATGPQFPSGTPAQITVNAGRDASGELYTAVLHTGAKELARFELRVPPGGAAPVMSGTWAFNASDTDVAPFTLGSKLPVFTATGQGTLTTDPAFKQFGIAGKLDVTADGLELVQAQLKPLGRVRLTADFDVQQRDNVVRVTTLTAALTGAQPIVTVETVQGFEAAFDPATGKLAEFKLSRPEADLLHLTIAGLPLAWAQPFVPGFELSGGAVRGEFRASARDGGFALRSVAPLTLDQISLAQAGRRLLNAVDVSLTTTADYTKQGWQAEIVDLSLRSAGASLLRLTSVRVGQATGTDQSLKASGSYEANLPAWLAQPATAGSVTLVTGAASGNFTASLGGKKEIALQLLLANLAAPGPQPLPDVALDARADLGADGKIDVQAPVVVTRNGRKSDLTMNATLTPGKDSLQVAAQITGGVVYVEDFKPFSALGAAPAAAPAPVATPVVAAKPPAAGPPWAGVNGEVKLSLKKVVYSADWSVGNLEALIKLGANSVALDSHAVLGADAPFSLSAGVNYSPEAKDRYALKTALTLTGFDVGAFLRASDPAHEPVLDAKVNLATDVTGSAPELAGLADHALGKVQLSSKGGVFRALTSDPASLVSTVSSTASGVAGVLGMLGGSSRAGQVGRSIGEKNQAITDIADALREIKFDQLNLTLSRDTQQNLALDDLTLISPTVRLAGQGKVQNIAGRPLLDQPLTLQLGVAARGRLADSMNRLSLLAATPDSLGYLPVAVTLPPLGGTLGNPDTGAFFGELFSRAVAKGAGSLLQGVGGGLLNNFLPGK